MTNSKTRIGAAVLVLAAAVIPLWGAGKPATRPATTKPTPGKVTATKPAVIAPPRNPLLPPSVAVEGFYVDLLLVAKIPAITPAGFEPLYAASDWQTFREKFGAEADGITKLKSSGQIAFAEKLIAAAENAPERSPVAPGLQRLLLTRAAAIAYRSKEGFPTADKAVQAYLKVMDKKSPAQLGALWSISNAMSRTSVTPRPDRIRYDGIAARANMQFSLLMLEADQIEAAQAMNKQIAYHEGWLRGDKFTLSLIAQVRGEVKHRATMMEYLGTQYQPALRNDVAALTSIYLYGRYVKQNAGIVADLPGRVPDSSLAQLARKLDGAARGDPESAFAAAETLRLTSAAIPDPHIRARTLYAAMQLYDTYMAAPANEKNRVQRTLARINREAVVADGARRSNAIDPFAAPPAPATAPAPAVLGLAAH